MVNNTCNSFTLRCQRPKHLSRTRRWCPRLSKKKKKPPCMKKNKNKHNKKKNANAWKRGGPHGNIGPKADIIAHWMTPSEAPKALQASECSELHSEACNALGASDGVIQWAMMSAFGPMFPCGPPRFQALAFFFLLCLFLWRSMGLGPLQGVALDDLAQAAFRDLATIHTPWGGEGAVSFAADVALDPWLVIDQ